MYLRLNEKQYNRLENILCPGGSWLFPDNLGGMLARKISRSMGWPVAPGDVVAVMEGWGREILSHLAGNISTAYKGQAGPTDYSRLWTAYSLYYLPANFPKVLRVLLGLLRGGVLPKKLKLLDIGTGPGTVSLAVLYFYDMISLVAGKEGLSVEITLLDRFREHLDFALANIKSWQVLQQISFPVKVNPVVCGCLEKESDQLRKLLNTGGYNLVVPSHVINEYELHDTTSALDVVQFALEMTADNGSLVIIEPATEGISRRIARLHWQLKSAGLATAFAPCAYPWKKYPGKQRRCACWSHACEPWHKPASVQVLEKYGACSKNDVDFNYLILRKDGLNRFKAHRNPGKYAREGYVKLLHGYKYMGEKVNIVGVATNVYRRSELMIIDICDGTCGTHNYCYIEARGNCWSPANDMLRSVRHGDFIDLRGVGVAPGARGSHYTLKLSGDTKAVVYR
ncbi:small ribosomal subunit Rsm22 [Desulfallas thermosapovorans DSM 6562]|uniref:Small ribosomal subunit Rsm22 n=2 Tax=Desulfallas thermosapovorans TaxID=58137 RepID=A0A5S4ZYB2_9FIRM|nr:small ribosomal subunit Rsm22 family protein [Desulfallas thermosapovorans]TYO98012.1 small ribosomal subunit Rsm22 [Desulfallas thermosapovorans DSM 6562]